MHSSIIQCYVLRDQSLIIGSGGGGGGGVRKGGRFQLFLPELGADSN